MPLTRCVRFVVVVLWFFCPPIVGAAETTGAEQIAGYSVEGRAIPFQVHGTGPDVLMVIATIHGNESAGTPLVHAFSAWLTQHPEELAGRQVVLIPVANPDGMKANARQNVNHVDLNRNFPAGNWTKREGGIHGNQPLSEPESRAILRLVSQFWPDSVISIHQPVACVDYDGPAGPLAQAMAKQCELPVKQIGSRPGSLGSFVGNSLNRPIITLELPKDAPHDPDQAWQQYGQAMLAALRFEAD